MQQLFVSQQSIKPSYLAFPLVSACARVVYVCVTQGISLVMKIKNHSDSPGKAVFCWSRAKGEQNAH